MSMTAWTARVDKAAREMPVDMLRELDAIARYCDCMEDGKNGQIPGDRIRNYQPGGEFGHLSAGGFIKASPRSFVALHQKHMPAVTMLPFGRAVLRRAAVLRDDLKEPTHRHRKRGSLHRITAVRVEVQTDRPIVEGDTLTIYVGEDGKKWARLDSEFNDGRFIDLAEGREW